MSLNFHNLEYNYVLNPSLIQKWSSLTWRSNLEIGTVCPHELHWNVICPFFETTVTHFHFKQIKRDWHFPSLIIIYGNCSFHNPIQDYAIFSKHFLYKIITISFIDKDPIRWSWQDLRFVLHGRNRSKEQQDLRQTCQKKVGQIISFCMWGIRQPFTQTQFWLQRNWI